VAQGVAPEFKQNKQTKTCSTPLNPKGNANPNHNKGAIAPI
jgi:hypothetical protein